MSLTGMSATRQKNCNGCVQAKRRCDRRTPTCSRCAEKMIPCVYSKSKINGRSARHGGASDISTSSLAPDFLDYPLIPSDFSMDVDYLDSMTKDFLPDFANGPPNQSPFDANINEDTYMDPLLNLIPGNRSSSPSQWLVCTKTDHVPESQTNEIYVRNCSAMAGCENIKPWHVYDPTTSLYFIWSRVKGFVPELGTKNALPFLHPHLYRSYMPQCILSCFATCVLYTSRTSVNTAMVMQSLYSNVGSLIAANTSRFVSTPIEKLARAQALFLYQIIRLFDGDVALRSQAEKDMPLFMTWVEELCNMRDNLGGPTVLEDSSVKSPQTIDWEKWIYAESVRRTVFMAFVVIGLYQLMKGAENIDAAPWSQIHRWTLSRSLWEAQSSSEFQRIWKENTHHVVDNFAFDHFFANLKVDEVDDFAEMFLAVYMGADATREFMSARGGGDNAKK